MRAGRIKISERLFLQWLQFPTAKILEDKFDTKFEILEFILEDAEMPEVKDNYIEDVKPLYIKHTDGMGNSIAVREPLNK